MSEWEEKGRIWRKCAEDEWRMVEGRRQAAWHFPTRHGQARQRASRGAWRWQPIPPSLLAPALPAATTLSIPCAHKTAAASSSVARTATAKNPEPSQQRQHLDPTLTWRGVVWMSGGREGRVAAFPAPFRTPTGAQMVNAALKGGENGRRVCAAFAAGNKKNRKQARRKGNRQDRRRQLALEEQERRRRTRSKQKKN